MNKDEYIAFMEYPDNIMNCDNCPECTHRNEPFRLPCGQFNCWVYLTCERLNEGDEE